MKIMFAMVIFLLSGCSFDFDSLTSGKDNVGKTGLAISVAPAGSSVVGFQINIYGPGMAACDSGSMTLGALAQSEYVALESENLPGSNNKFANKFFVLQAGAYCVEATPKDSAGNKVDACSVARGGPYPVASSQTNEVMLVSNCGGPDNGGLGTVVAVNNKPLIAEVLFDRGQHVGTCETLKVTASASDPDGDALTYDWVVEAKPGSNTDFEASFSYNVYTFRSFVSGNYMIRLTVCDEHQLCAFLSFPIHVSGSACAPLPTDAGSLPPDGGVGG